jgi:hypothetical protein
MSREQLLLETTIGSCHYLNLKFSLDIALMELVAESNQQDSV